MQKVQYFSLVSLFYDDYDGMILSKLVVRKHDLYQLVYG
jgi:hypothetical protein